MTPGTWCDAVALALVPTLENTPLETVQRRVESGIYQLWLYRKCVIITERQHSHLMVWAIAGSHLAAAARDVIRHALREGFCTVKFRTTHAGVLRMLWNFNPVLTDAPNCEYTVWLAPSKHQAPSPALQNIHLLAV